MMNKHKQMILFVILQLSRYEHEKVAFERSKMIIVTKTLVWVVP